MVWLLAPEGVLQAGIVGLLVAMVERTGEKVNEISTAQHSTVSRL